jgi:hypothetical protein
MGRIKQMATPAGDDWIDSPAAARITDADIASMDLSAGFDDVLAHVWNSTTPVARKRNRKRFVLALTLAGTIVVGGTGVAVGAATGIGNGKALSGVFGKPGFTENDTSEYVNLDAPDFPAVARQIAARMQADGMRFAPGYVPQKEINGVITSEVKLGGTAQVTGVQGDFATDAQFTWLESWWHAYKQHDKAGMATDAAGLRQNASLLVWTKDNNLNFSRQLADAASSGNAAYIHQILLANDPEALK